MNGLLIIDKPQGYTSRDIVNIIGKKFKTSSVGHTGTLDPLATGVLVVAINEGLKVVSLISNEVKEYIAEVKCGVLTDTLDVTGNILKEDYNFKLDKNNLINVLNGFLGKSIQEVPIYSAVKVKGKKLYEYARNNEDIELPKKEIEIYDIELLKCDEYSFSFRVLVSKGTYIRSLIRDIGYKLNILCSMQNLRRLRAGDFNIKDAYSLNDIVENNFKIVPIKDVLKDYKNIEVDSYIENKIMNGSILENRYDDEQIIFLNSDGKILAIYEVYAKDKNKVKPFKIFKL